MSPAMLETLNKAHPCFYAGAKGKYGRLHLPVAQSCNIQCAYCRRDHDCPNENRPGVTQGVIEPDGYYRRLCTVGFLKENISNREVGELLRLGGWIAS